MTGFLVTRFIYLSNFVPRKKIQEINWQRKNEQSQAGGKLKDLENRLVLFCLKFVFILQYVFFLSALLHFAK